MGVIAAVGIMFCCLVIALVLLFKNQIEYHYESFTTASKMHYIGVLIAGTVFTSWLIS